MKRRLATFFALLVGLVIVCGPAMAHHGSQGYDYSVPRKMLKGTVAQFAWQNPHSQIYLDVKDDKGNVVSWAMELNNPGNLVGLGWTHSSVKAGDEVTVTFNPGKNGRPVGICVDVLFADGRKLHSTQGCIGKLGSYDELRLQDNK